MADMAELVEAYKALPPETVSIIAWEASPWAERDTYSRRIMSREIQPLHVDMRVVGPAFTVNDSLLCANAIQEAPAGHVLVVDASDREASHFGQLVTQMFMMKGLEGAVIDGYVCHKAKIIKMGFPVFARGATIRYAGVKLKGEINVPIQCGGVLVHPGDFIIGNADGVFVMRPDEAERFLVGAQRIAEIGRVFMEYMESGTPYFDIPGVRDFWDQKASQEGEEWKIYDRWLERYGKH